MYSGLLVDAFRFFKEGIETEAYKTEAYKVLYKGILKTLLILLHDFPDFLIEASFILIENVPKQFLQIKNVILSAYPLQMKVPDPFRISEPVLL
jgi:CCR4-NOT transcription complex subunit 1